MARSGEQPPAMGVSHVLCPPSLHEKHSEKLMVESLQLQPRESMDFSKSQVRAGVTKPVCQCVTFQCMGTEGLVHFWIPGSYIQSRSHWGGKSAKDGTSQSRGSQESLHLTSWDLPANSIYCDSSTLYVFIHPSHTYFGAVHFKTQEHWNALQSLSY